MKSDAPKRLSEKKVFQTRRFSVFDAKLRIAGKIVHKPYVRQNACAEILALTDDGRVVLIRSYRPELDGHLYELPAGTLKDRERPEKAARRELEEETGYVAGKITRMFSGHPLLGYSDCKYHFFLATKLKKKKQRLEDDESIKVRLFGQEEVRKMLARGNVKDLNVPLAMMYYLLAKKRFKV